MKPLFRERLTEADRTWREKVIPQRDICMSLAVSAAMILTAVVAS